MTKHSDTERFLQAVFGDDFGTAAILANLNPPFHTRSVDQLDDLRDCYWSVAAFAGGHVTRTIDKALEVRALVVDDIGTKVPEDAVRLGLGNPTAITETSAGNYQWAYRLSTPVPVADWPGVFAEAERLVGCKLEGKDAVHLFRLPMGVNTKAGRGRFPVRLVSVSPGVVINTPNKNYRNILHQPSPSGPGPSTGDMGLEELRELLGFIPNDLERDGWIEVGHGIKALCENDADGFTVFDEWSQRHDSYDAGHTRTAWDSFGAGGLKAKGGALKDRAEKSRAFARAVFDDDPPPPPSPPSGGGAGGTTHVDMAEEIIGRERGELGWMSNASSRWAGFDPVMGRWVIEEHDALMRASVRDAVHTARLAAVEPKDARKMAEAKWRGAVQGLLVRERRLMLPFDSFDADLDTFGVPGGAIRLQAGGAVLESGRADQLISKSMAVRPAPVGTKGVAWEKFLDDFTMGDVELRAWWQSFCGYCLTGRTDHHAVVFVYGPGGNGKSVFLDTLAAVMGGYHRRAPHTLFMAQQGSKHMASVADLVGARLVTTPDVPSQASWDLGLVKSLTGGGTFKAQFMRENWFEFTPQFKLVLPGNEKPDFGGSVDRAIRRRFWLVPALHVPKTVNINLVDTLKRELPCVLRWMLDGWEAYNMFGGFPPCKLIERETKDYLDEMDVFGKWKETLVKAPGDRTRHRIGDLWSSWDAFRAGEGSWKASPVNKQALTTKLREAGFSIDRDKQGAYVDQITITKSTIF